VDDPRLLVEREFHRHFDQSRSLPLPVLRDLTPAQLALWLPKRAADGRAGQLAQWLKAELARQDV
jgi:hypothetical protein